MIYTVENAPPGLKVFLGNKELKQVFMADSSKGVVTAYRQPLKADKHGKRWLSYTLRGNVRFEL